MGKKTLALLCLVTVVIASLFAVGCAKREEEGGEAEPAEVAGAEFQVSNLTITPVEVKVGESVTVSVDVKNVGEVEGTYTVTLKVNGVKTETKEVTLAGGATDTVSFTIVKDIGGTFDIEVGGLTTTLMVHAAQVPAVLPPDKPGPYPTGWYLVDYYAHPYGEYDAIIYYPAKRDGCGAPKDTSGAPYPGIVVANGFAGPGWTMTWLPKHLASHGYVAMVFSPPVLVLPDPWQWGKGFTEGMDELGYQNRREFSPIHGILDTNTFGAIGLSVGGGGCILATEADSRIDAAVGLAPFYVDLDDVEGIWEIMAQFHKDVYEACENITVPIQLQVGQNDRFVQPNWVEAAYDDVPNTTTKEFLVIEGASHGGYIDTWIAPVADAIEQLLGGGNTCGFDEQHRRAQKYFTSWFQYHLKGISGYSDYILGGVEVQNDLVNGILIQLKPKVQVEADVNAYHQKGIELLEEIRRLGEEAAKQQS